MAVLSKFIKEQRQRMKIGGAVSLKSLWNSFRRTHAKIRFNRYKSLCHQEPECEATHKGWQVVWSHHDE